MEEKNKREEIQSRREFFKKAAKAALPVVGAAILSSVPFMNAEATPSECYLSACSGTCTGTCSGLCTTSCQGGCANHACQTDCMYSCSGGCDGGCFGTCSSSSY